MKIPASKTLAALGASVLRGHRGAWLLLLLGVSIGLGGAVLELKLRPRALPQTDAPLVAKPLALTMEPKDLNLVVLQVAPHLDDGLRGKLVDAVLLESTRNRTDPLFLLALVGVESGWHLSAESQRGARGLLQMKPSTFAWISAREPDVGGEDLESGDDPVVDVRLAIRYFSWLEKKFKSRDSALMAYNAGPRRTLQHLRLGDVPDGLLAYPQRVRHEYERLLNIANGSELTLVVPRPAYGLLASDP